MFDQWEQVNFFTEWNVRRGASTRVTPPPRRTGASKERLIPDEFYRHAALNLRCFKTAKDRRLLLQRTERDLDTRTSSNKVRTRKLANLFKRPSTFLLRHYARVVIYLGWTLGSGTDLPTLGYVAMALGVILSLAVGFGLMALLFFSNRKGYNEPPALTVLENDSNQNRLPRSRPWVSNNPINLIAKNQRPADASFLPARVLLRCP